MRQKPRQLLAVRGFHGVSPAATTARQRSGRLIVFGLLAFVRLTVAQIGVEATMTPLRRSRWNTLPAYATHALSIVAALGILRVAGLSLPSISLRPRVSKRFILLAPIFLALGLVSGWRTPAFNTAALSYGWLVVLMRLGFETAVVGWTDEVLFRGAPNGSLFAIRWPPSSAGSMSPGWGSEGGLHPPPDPHPT